LAQRKCWAASSCAALLMGWSLVATLAAMHTYTCIY
jgi:hypothetical protein